MNKRILMLMAIGISFASPAFAAGVGEAVSVHASGELKLADTDLRGAQCILQAKVLPSDQGESAVVDSAAPTAHRAL